MRTGALAVCLLALLAGANATTYTSGGSCTAIASTSQEAHAKDACISAVAVAVNHGCSAKQGDTLVRDFRRIFHESASAFAKVATFALSQCTTYNNAYGCAAGEAVAKKFAYAHFEAIAEAFAEAFNKCEHCDPKAAAYINARVLIDMVAGAFAKVRTNVCVGPNQSAIAVAWEKCCALVIADGFARACAKALIAGKCASQTALAEVEARVKVETSSYCHCKGYTYTEGQGWTRATRTGGWVCADWNSL